jgi:hypothetical protein
LIAAALRPAGYSEEKSRPIPVEDFDKLFKITRPYPDESIWSDIPWLMDTIEARKKAAAENKPLLVWTMSGWPLGCA